MHSFIPTLLLTQSQVKFYILYHSLRIVLTKGHDRIFVVFISEVASTSIAMLSGNKEIYAGPMLWSGIIKNISQGNLRDPVHAVLWSLNKFKWNTDISR